MEKTLEELIEENKKVEFSNEDPFYNPNYVIDINDVLKLLQQVREATSEEFCQAILGVTLPAETVMKIGKIVTATDRIKLTNENAN